MVDKIRIEDAINAVLAATDKPLGGQISTDEDDLFAELMAEAELENQNEIA